MIKRMFKHKMGLAGIACLLALFSLSGCGTSDDGGSTAVSRTGDDSAAVTVTNNNASGSALTVTWSLEDNASNSQVLKANESDYFTTYDPSANSDQGNGYKGWCNGADDCSDSCVQGQVLQNGSSCKLYFRGDLAVVGESKQATVSIAMKKGTELVAESHYTLTNNTTFYAEQDNGSYSYVAKYNGSTGAWNPVGVTSGSDDTTNGKFNAAIRTMNVNGLGDIYVAGNLYDGVTTCRYVSHYVAGAGWSPLGRVDGSDDIYTNGCFANGPIAGLVVSHEGYPYVAGFFHQTIDDVNTYYVSAYREGAWGTVGFDSGSSDITTTNGHFNGTTYSMAFDSDDNLYIGGTFTEDATEDEYLAKYSTNGTWSAVALSGTPGDHDTGDNGRFNGAIFGINFDAQGNIYLTGNMTVSEGEYYVDEYNIGSGAWSIFGDDKYFNVGTEETVFDSLGNAYISGSFNEDDDYYLAQSDAAGNNWTEYGGAVFNGATALTYFDSEGNLYEVGDFTNQSGQNYIAEIKAVGAVEWSQLGDALASDTHSVMLVPTMSISPRS